MVQEAVQLATVTASEVKLGRDLVSETENQKRLDAYLPTETSRRALSKILRGTAGTTRKRVHLLTGSYGTGKSYLMLVLANLLALPPDDERLHALRSRIADGADRYDDDLGEEIERARMGGDGYLVVAPDYSETDFQYAMLRGLRDALDGEDIDYRPKTEAQQALAIIENWEASKPDLFEELTRTAEKDGRGLPRLRAALDRHDDPGALDAFAGYFKDITGAPLSFDRVKIEETYRDVVRYLRAEHDMKGIAVLFDEFGDFLSEVINRPDGARGLGVQDFIEFVKRERQQQILFVMAAHRSLDDYAEGSASSKDIKKIEGRFEEKHRLRISTRHNEAEEMIGKTFIPADTDDAEALLAAARARLHDLFFEEDWAEQTDPWYPDQTSAWVCREVVKDIYPLHPVVVRALPQLSERAGQSERTMFRFLSKMEERPGSAASFVEAAAMLQEHGAASGSSEVNGAGNGRENGGRSDTRRLNLLALDRLYDYFLAPIDTRAASLGDVEPARFKKFYEDARAKLSIGEDEALAQRVLKAVSVIELTSDKALQATAATLHWALGLPPARRDTLDPLLDELAGQEALRCNPTTGIYSFRRYGQSIEELMGTWRERLAPLRGGDLTGAFREARPLEGDEHEPHDYNYDHVTNRRVCFDYLVPGTVEQAVREWTDYFEKIYEKGNNRPYRGNVVVLYGLIESEGSRQALFDARERFPEKWRPYLVFAVSDVPHDLAGDALDFEAARCVATDDEIEGNDRAQTEAFDRVTEYQTHLRGQLDSALRPEHFSWHHDGDERFAPNELDTDARDDFFDRLIAEELFPATPVIKNDTVQHYEKNRVNPHNKSRRYDVIDTFVSGQPFKLGGSSHEEQMIEGLLKPNDMFRHTETRANEAYGYVKPPPEDALAHAAWQVLERTLRTEETACQLREATHTLYQKPFGLSYPAVELLVGAFIGHSPDDFTLKHQGRLVPLSGENIAAAIAEPGKYVLRYQSLLDGERAYLKALGERFDARLDTDIERAGPWEDVARKGRSWLEALPPVTRAFAPAEHDEAGALIEVFDEAGTRPPQALLTEDLPEALNTEDHDLGNRDLEDRLFREELLDAVDEGLQAGGRFAGQFAERVLFKAAHEAFDAACSSLREVERAVEAWWSEHVQPATRRHDFDLPADAFLDRAGRDGSSLEDQLLRKLASDWQLPPVEEWTKRQQRRDYLDRFTKSVREISAWRASPVPVLNRVLETAFDAEEQIEMPEAFDDHMQAWLNALPEATREALERGDFGDEASALRDAILREGPVAECFLVWLPERLGIPGGGWPNWNQVAENNLVFGIADAVEEVEGWRPPWTAGQVLDALGERFPGPPPASPEAFDERARRWYASLSPAARRHDFDGLAGTLTQVLDEEQSVSEAVRERLPRAAGLPPLAEMREAERGEALVERLAGAYQTVQTWERPLRDVWAAPYARLDWSDGEGNGSDTLEEASQFALRLKHWLSDLPHARYVAPERFDENAPAQALVAWADARRADRAAPFEDFIAAAGLPADWRSWTREEDERFVETLAEAKRHVEAWEPPEQDARERVAEVLRTVQQEEGMSTDNILDVLRELIETWSRNPEH
jgi:hypothetical protein